MDRDSQLSTLIRKATHTSALEGDVGCHLASALTCITLKYGALSPKSHAIVIPGTAISYNREGKKPFSKGSSNPWGWVEKEQLSQAHSNTQRTHGKLRAHKSMRTPTLKHPKLRYLFPKKPKGKSQHMTAYRDRSESHSHDMT